MIVIFCSQFTRILSSGFSMKNFVVDFFPGISPIHSVQGELTEKTRMHIPLGHSWFITKELENFNSTLMTAGIALWDPSLSEDNKNAVSSRRISLPSIIMKCTVCSHQVHTIMIVNMDINITQSIFILNDKDVQSWFSELLIWDLKQFKYMVICAALQLTLVDHGI